MVENKASGIKKCLRWGLICIAIYSIYFILVLLSYLLKGNLDALNVVVFVSAPTSAVILGLADHILDLLGPPDSMARQAAAWFAIYIAGIIQYFFLGFFVSTMLSKNDA